MTPQTLFYSLYYQHYIICPTGLAPAIKSKLSTNASKFGIQVYKNWDSDCTHACVPKEHHPITIKLLMALVNSKPVVTADWVSAWGEPHRTKPNDPPPKEEDYLPPSSVTEGYDYSPHSQRKIMLQGFLAVYATESATSAVLKEAGAEVYIASSMQLSDVEHLVDEISGTKQIIILISKYHEEHYESLWTTEPNIREIKEFLKEKGITFVSEYDIFQSITAGSAVGSLAEASQADHPDREYLTGSDLPLFKFRAHTRNSTSSHGIEATENMEENEENTDKNSTMPQISSSAGSKNETPDHESNFDMPRVSGGALGKWTSVRNERVKKASEHATTDDNEDDQFQPDVLVDLTVNSMKQERCNQAADKTLPNFKAFKGKGSKTKTSETKPKRVRTKRAQEFEERQLPQELDIEHQQEEQQEKAKDKLFEEASKPDVGQKRSSKEFMNLVDVKKRREDTESIRQALPVSPIKEEGSQSQTYNCGTSQETTQQSKGTLRKKAGVKGKSKVKLI